MKILCSTALWPQSWLFPLGNPSQGWFPLLRHDALPACHLNVPVFAQVPGWPTLEATDSHPQAFLLYTSLKACSVFPSPGSQGEVTLPDSHLPGHQAVLIYVFACAFARGCGSQSHVWMAGPLMKRPISFPLYHTVNHPVQRGLQPALLLTGYVGKSFDLPVPQFSCLEKWGENSQNLVQGHQPCAWVWTGYPVQRIQWALFTTMFLSVREGFRTGQEIKHLHFHLVGGLVAAHVNNFFLPHTHMGHVSCCG